MATFTYVPNILVAESLGSITGKAVGNFSAKASTAILKAKEQLSKVCEKALSGDPNAYSELDNIERTLSALQSSANGIKSTVNTISTLTVSMNAALQAAKVALRLANMLAFLPVPPPATMAFDLLGELVAQLSEVISALEALTKTLNSLLDNMLTGLSTLVNQLSTLKLSKSLDSVLGTKANLAKELADNTSSKDIKDLHDSGLVDNTGTSFFTKVGSVFTSDVNRLEIDLDGIGINLSVKIQNRIRGGKVGDIIVVTPEKTIQLVDSIRSRSAFYRFLVVNGKEELSELYNEAVDILAELPLSIKLKSDLHKLDVENHIKPEQQITLDELRYYRVPNSLLVYRLDIVVDPNSPEVAARRYVTATETTTGKLFYTGPKTFALDDNLLFLEARVDLDNLFLM